MEDEKVEDIIGNLKKAFNIKWDITLYVREEAERMSAGSIKKDKRHFIIIPASHEKHEIFTYGAHEFCHLKLGEDIDVLFSSILFPKEYDEAINRGILGESYVIIQDIDTQDENGKKILELGKILRLLMDVWADDLFRAKMKEIFDIYLDNYFDQF